MMKQFYKSTCAMVHPYVRKSHAFKLTWSNFLYASAHVYFKYYLTVCSLCIEIQLIKRPAESPSQVIHWKGGILSG